MPLLIFVLLVLFLVVLLLPKSSNAREVQGEIQYNKDSCWDVGYQDYINSAGDCQRQCTLTSGCNSWSFLHDDSIRRCHLCTWTEPRTDISCSTGIDPPCRTWGLKEDGAVDAADILNAGIAQATKVCNGSLTPDDALAVAQDLNLIVNKYRTGEYDSDANFVNNLQSVANQAASILRQENKICVNNYTGPDHACNYGSLVFHQLRALLLYVDGNASRAYPRRFDKLYKKLFNRYKVFLADNRSMRRYTLRRFIRFYSQLPSHIFTEGILYDALFATQTVRDAWKCNGQDPGYYHTTNRGYNVFQTQVGQSYEQAFPDDTPNKPPSMDLQLTVTRHEVAHQFDRIIANRADTRLKDMKTALTLASAGSDSNWLRSQVGDAYFQSAPQEIIAAQVGNQFLATTSSQLRLAAYRLTKSDSWVNDLSYSKVDSGIATLTRENKSCSLQTANLGTFSTSQACVDAAMANDACSYEIMYSSTYPSWGCRCCAPIEDLSCATEESVYNNHDLWDVYQYENSPNEATCDSTGLPLNWFLFNVDLFTPVDSSIVRFYENESNGAVTLVEVLITRDAETNSINSLDVPFCDGVISIGYDNNEIVNSVSSNAANCTFACVDDPNWMKVTASGNEQSCSWVAKKPSVRCNVIGKDGRKAANVCLKSCYKGCV